MTITAQWADAEETTITATIDGVSFSVPNAPGNRHRQMIAEWEAEGNVITSYAADTQTLPDLAPYQFRAMLSLSGKEEDLATFVEALPEPQKTITKSKLEYSLAFHRDNELVEAARVSLNLTNEQLNTLWLEAATI